MKLYLIDGKGYWEDSNSHCLPLEVEVAPCKELAEVEINGEKTTAVNGHFTISKVGTSIIVVIVDGMKCEPLIKNGVRVCAPEKGVRALLPYAKKVEDLEKRVKELEELHKQHDFFG